MKFIIGILLGNLIVAYYLLITEENKLHDEVVLCDSIYNGSYDRCRSTRRATFTSHLWCAENATNLCYRLSSPPTTSVFAPHYQQLSCIDPTEKVTFISCKEDGAKIILLGKNEELRKY